MIMDSFSYNKLSKVNVLASSHLTYYYVRRKLWSYYRNISLVVYLYFLSLLRWVQKI
jgi:hypothetical protein